MYLVILHDFVNTETLILLMIMISINVSKKKSHMNDGNMWKLQLLVISNLFRTFIKILVFICKGKALCGSKNCRAELGCIQILKDHPKISPIYPLKCLSIKIRQIQKDNEKPTIILKNQWKKMPFKIPSLELLCTNNNDDIFYDADDILPSDL